MIEPRIVCQFSCGAASAVATKRAIVDHPGREVGVVNAFIAEEHEDNRRFLRDCEVWFGVPVQVVQSEAYSASTLEVFRRRQYMNGPHGAPCSMELKRKVLKAIARPDDVMVLGFTAEEEDRFEDFKDRFPDQPVLAPLITHGLSKADCLAVVERAGIAPPAMYGLGYSNANCIGCVKGGEGYWNKIRVDFPARFEEVATLQEQIGPGAYFFRNRKTGERFGLRQLPPDSGRSPAVLPDCSFFCDAMLDVIGAAS